MPRRRAHGEGSLYRRESDGRWVGALPANLAPTGRRRVVYGATRSEALAKLEALKTRARAGALGDPKRVTVASFLEEFLRSVRVSGRSPRTHALYAYAVYTHLAPRIGHLRLSALAPAHLTRLYDALLTEVPNRRKRAQGNGRGLSATSVASVHRTIHAALKLAVRWGAVPRNVADDVEPPRPRPAEAVTLTAERVRAFLLDAAARGDPLLAAWYVAADTGARRAELVALRWDDLDTRGARPRLHVRRRLENLRIGPPVFANPKTARGRRPLTISAATLGVLLAHKAHQEDERAGDPAWHDYGLVFPAAHGLARPGQLLYDAFKRAARRAGLPPGIRLHGLRHSMATIALAGGASVDAVSRRLGHSSGVVTLGTYAHAVATSEDRAADAMADALAPPPADLPAPIPFRLRGRPRRA